MAASEALYDFKVQTDKKVFYISFHGFFTLEKAEPFPEEFENTLRPIHPQEYSLVLDTADLAVLRPEILPLLEECYKLYMSKNFKKIIIVNSANVAGRSQIKRVGAAVNLVADFVDTVEEAFEIAGR